MLKVLRNGQWTGRRREREREGGGEGRRFFSPAERWGCSSVDRASDRHVADAGSIPWCGKRLFFSFPRVNFQYRLSYGVRTTPCAIACIYICVHVKDPVVHVKVRLIMETPKHLTCTVGWVARPCRSWLSPGKATRISHGRNPIGTIQL